jgi:biofilm PGA synthesis N-glycosyltransferase PgaC
MTALCLVSLALVAYTYAGYPLLIGLLARLSARPPLARATSFPAVTVCLPVHDGAAFLEGKLRSLIEQDYPGPLEILVYSDGSRDGTEALARACPGVTAIAGQERRGKPAALNRLVAEATGELLLLNDVRQPLDRGAVRALAAQLSDPRVGCATGALEARGGAGSGAYWRYERWIRRCESRFRGVVGATGAIMMVRRRDLLAIGPLPEDLILDDVYIPLRIGGRVVQDERARAYDRAFEDGGEFRRKVRTLAGNFQLLAAMPRLLVPFANPLWFETISHKVLRLLAPFLLLTLLASSLIVAGRGGPWWPAAAQLVAYGVAVVGARAGQIGRLARTFVVLNAAALAGLWRHLAGSQKVTW